MRYLSTLIILAFVLPLAAFAAGKKAEQDSIPKDPYAKLVRCWKALQEKRIGEAQFDHCWMGFLRSGNITPYEKPLEELIASGIGSDNRKEVRQVAIGMMGLFQDERHVAVLERLITDDDPLKAEAAHYLLKWGYWEVAAPVLREAGIFEDLVDDPRGQDLLRMEVKTSPPSRRLAAAEALYDKLNLPDSLKLVARGIVQLPGGFRNADVTKRAVDILSKDPTADDIAAFTRIVIADTNEWCRNAAFAAVVTQAFGGDSSALAGLDSITLNSPDAAMRSRAEGYIKAAKSGKAKSGK